MPPPTEDTFLKISADYMKIWNFPNCLGALDSKHVKIICPKHSGSMYYNYKKFFSIVLQAVCDASYRFIMIEVGSYGRQSDGGTYQNSAMFRLLSSKRLNIPSEQCLPNTDTRMPFVFIADEAYPLQYNLLKPYSREVLNAERLYFNQRLSRARKTIECSFGILYAKWRILSKAIETDEKVADMIVKAICILHNIIIDSEGFERHLNTVTGYDIDNNAFRPSWNARGRTSNRAIFIRDTFKDYVNAFPVEFESKE